MPTTPVIVSRLDLARGNPTLPCAAYSGSEKGGEAHHSLPPGERARCFVVHQTDARAQRCFPAGSATRGQLPLQCASVLRRAKRPGVHCFTAASVPAGPRPTSDGREYQLSAPCVAYLRSHPTTITHFKWIGNVGGVLSREDRHSPVLVRGKSRSPEETHCTLAIRRHAQTAAVLHWQLAISSARKATVAEGRGGGLDCRLPVPGWAIVSVDPSTPPPVAVKVNADAGIGKATGVLGHLVWQQGDR